MVVQYLQGDCREVLKGLPAGSVQCVVTSPPYMGLRRYLPAGHPDAGKEIGREPSPTEYVAALVEVFREVWRVLRDDGVLFINLGDSYNAAGRTGHGTRIGAKQGTNRASATGADCSRSSDDVLKPKDLLMIPARVALALQADGWWIRQDIIWAKTSCMPESVTDRCTTSHEHVFHLTKSETYYWDGFAIAEPSTGIITDKGGLSGVYSSGSGRGDGTGHYSGGFLTGATRNKRSVWTINPQPFSGSHFATMPPLLVETCIKAGSSEKGCCPHCGSPWERIIEIGEPDEAARKAAGADLTGGYSGHSTKGHAAAGVQDASAVKARILEGMRVKRTVGWRPTCKCPEHKPVPCVVLDPFSGAGTTAMVANNLQRDAIGIELNPEYVDMARCRIEDKAGLFGKYAWGLDT
jgi:DNA modification methylase